MFPIKLPQPARSAFLLSFPANNSPAKAPKNVPMKIPKGGKKMNPTSMPIIDPHMPAFEAGEALHALEELNIYTSNYQCYLL